MVPVVDLSQIERQVKILRCQLIKQQIPYEKLVEYLVSPDMQAKQRGTYAQIKGQLSREPFSVKDEDFGHLMSRYLTEGDIKEQYVLFDPERFSPLGLIKLRFLDMVAVYEFPVETGLEDKYADFKKWLVSKSSPIQEFLSKNAAKDPQVFDLEVLEKYIASEKNEDYDLVSDLFILDILNVDKNTHQIPVKEFCRAFGLEFTDQASDKQ